MDILYLAVVYNTLQLFGLCKLMYKIKGNTKSSISSQPHIHPEPRSLTLKILSLWLTYVKFDVD